MMVPVRKDPEADPACHANTDIHPEQYVLATKIQWVKVGISTCYITKELLIPGRGKLRDPVILAAGGWCPIIIKCEHKRVYFNL